jgi:hypothetical protein
VELLPQPSGSTDDAVEIQRGLEQLRSMNLCTSNSDHELRRLLNEVRDGEGRVSVEIVVHRIFEGGIADLLETRGGGSKDDGTAAVHRAAAGNDAPAPGANAPGAAAAVQENPAGVATDGLTNTERLFIKQHGGKGKYKITENAFKELDSELRLHIMHEYQWEAELTTRQTREAKANNSCKTAKGRGRKTPRVEVSRDNH